MGAVSTKTKKVLIASKKMRKAALLLLFDPMHQAWRALLENQSKDYLLRAATLELSQLKDQDQITPVTLTIVLLRVMRLLLICLCLYGDVDNGSATTPSQD